MIIVKNRELLIPNNERYIGTTYDNETENRVFQVPRFSQRGVDLAALTFRLDIQYANEAFDTVLLDKEVGEAFIILVWRITSSTLQVPGTLYIGLRAIDDEATVKWSSFSAAMYAERHLNTPGNYGGSLTEIEQIEQDHQYMKGVVDELKANIDYAHDAEAWAKGTRSGSAVPSTDPTYHNNSKYYSQQANTKATQAANSATAAANSATQAADTVADTNTRFNNAVAAVTVNTEVQDARVGADGTQHTVLKNRLDAEHNQLNSAIDEISEVASEEEVTRSITATWTDGYVGTDGRVVESTTFHYTNKIAVKEGDVVSTSSQNFRFVTAYNNGVVVPSKGDALGNDNAYTVPSDIDEIVITKYKTAGTDLTQKTTEAVISAKDTVARSDIEQLATVVDAEQEQYTKDITLTITWTSGYMDTSGAILASSSLVYSNHISVVEGDVVSCSNAFRFVTAFANGSAVSAKGDASGDNKTYTVPSGVDEVVVSIYTPEKDIIRSTEVTEYVAKRKPFGIFRASGDLNSGEAFSFADQNINKKIVTIFTADIQSFSAIQVGRKTTSSDGYWVVVDATNITIYKDGTASTPVAHGLTVANNIQVKIATDTDGKSNPRNFFKAVITVTSNGQSFSVTENYWTNKSNGNLFVLSSGSILKNCSFSFQSLDFNKLIYAFGDSYFSWYPERWVFYLAQDGYADNILTNAFAGEPSSAAVKALRAIVPMGFPKYLLWCLGMNDGSDSADAPNANWASGRDEVINICKEYGITPVFATIPTVPTINNEKKNEWIRSSGYRYVDFAKAVGAQADGTWYSDMLDDGVHPTEAGAKSLYNRLLADFPEVMIEN